ncbi:GNAT family N-acetyltransferase [uncultured Massilia sp.]|uniref:GNAT family N-acetyltransferase n=1 Tax=uncultured Massilia sp. TaxID=169973 RepID=UPI0025FE6837|nr:GNAT family N-acetyltransferase [uncultured Massilia sp.]
MNAATARQAMAPQAAIRPAGEADLAPFFAYLDDHLRDNGIDGTPLFQPLPRDSARMPPGLRLAFIRGVALDIGEPGWRRLWLALGPTGDIAGHVDLRGRPEPGAPHRAMLGMGVHRAWRRRGLGLRLLATAVDWARATPHRDGGARIDWIDLEVLSANTPACALYVQAGFDTVARLADMLRIDGASHDLSYMTLKLR